MRVPFELIKAEEGSRIRLRFAIWREHLPVDSLPLEGWIDLHAVAGRGAGDESVQLLAAGLKNSGCRLSDSG